MSRVLIEEGLQMTRELYLSIVLDRASGKPVMMASAAGGMDIEEVAAATPEKIARVYIEPGVPHEVFNLSNTEPVVAVVARSDASEWENIIPYGRNRQ